MSELTHLFAEMIHTLQEARKLLDRELEEAFAVAPQDRATLERLKGSAVNCANMCRDLQQMMEARDAEKTLRDEAALLCEHFGSIENEIALRLRANGRE